MLRVKLKGRDVAGELEDLARRADDLSATDAQIRDEVTAQNARVNFNPDHPASLLEVSAGSGRIGSERSSYGELLDVDVEPLAEIERAWMLEGSQ